MNNEDPMLAKYYGRILEIECRWAAFMDRRPDLVINNYAHAYLEGQRQFWLGSVYLNAANRALA